jgi:Arc/MetJ family transcription regulator
MLKKKDDWIGLFLTMAIGWRNGDRLEEDEAANFALNLDKVLL